MSDDSKTGVAASEGSPQRLVGREYRPEIGDIFERGDRALRVVDISESRVWLLETKSGEGETYTWFLREKYHESVAKSMAVEGTVFTPANGSADGAKPQARSASGEELGPLSGGPVEQCLRIVGRLHEVRRAKRLLRDDEWHAPTLYDLLDSEEGALVVQLDRLASETGRGPAAPLCDGPEELKRAVAVIQREVQRRMAALWMPGCFKEIARLRILDAALVELLPDDYAETAGGPAQSNSGQTAG